MDEQVVSQVVLDVAGKSDQDLPRPVRKDALNGADDDQRRAKYRQRVRILRVVVGKKKAQSDLRQVPELRQRNLGALDAIRDDAKDQRQKRAGNPHAGLRNKADHHFRFVARHIREQAHELRPSGDALVRCLRYRSGQCICRCAHFRMDCGVSSDGTSLRYLS